MNVPSHNESHAQQARSRDEHFDAAMRGLHRAAAANVSPQVRHRLRPAQAPQDSVGGILGDRRRHPALIGVGAAALACTLALALGLALWRPAQVTAPAADAPVAGEDDGATVLEQDPDFYAWLASDDVALVAME
jgi:hypothetical protein